MADSFDVFVSYATSDIDLVWSLVRELRRADFKVWFDQDQMASGGRVFGRLADAIADSSHMLVCLSDAYIRRDWTAFELDSNQYLDPANRRNRTIPVALRPLTLELPPQIRAFAVRDLSNPAVRDAEYQKIVELLRSHRRAGPTESDRAELRRACETPFAYLDEPVLALFQIRRGTAVIARYLHREWIGDVPVGATLDSLIADLLRCDELPEAIRWSLETVQRYGSIALREGVDGSSVSARAIRPGLAAFEVLSDWTATRYLGPSQVKPSIGIRLPTILPVGPGRDERRIPDTAYSYIFRPQVGAVGQDPLYEGRRHEGDEKRVLVNLVDLPESDEPAFFARIARFSRSETSTVVTPLGAGRVVANGARQCLYVALPWVDGVGVGGLVKRFASLPQLAALQVGLGVADALTESQRVDPALMFTAIDLANVLVDRFGSVRVVCGYAETGHAAQEANLRALRAVVSQLVAEDPQLAGTAEQLALATTAQQARDILAEACDRCGGGLDLATVIGCYHDGRGLEAPTGGHVSGPAGGEVPGSAEAEAPGPAGGEVPGSAEAEAPGPAGGEVPGSAEAEAPGPAGGEVPGSAEAEAPGPAGGEVPGSAEAEAPGPATTVPVASGPPVRTFGALSESPVESLKAWPLGGSRVLVWEAGTRKLAIFGGQKPLWRDSQPIEVRRVATGPGGRLAVGGWDGHVRLFVNGEVAAAVKLDGAVGDLRISRDRVVAGGWKGALWSIREDGGCEELLGVDRGVHRVAVNDSGDRFAVADLAGGIAVYTDNVRTSVRVAGEITTISDVAFAGSRLVVLMDEELVSLGAGGHLGSVQPRAGAFGLLPGSVPGYCRLLVERGGNGDDAALTTQELWRIDEAARQELRCTFPAGYQLRGTCDIDGRFVLAVPAGAGCAYWRDGVELRAWTDATAAEISPDGCFIAVSRPGRVELFEDPPVPGRTGEPV